MTTSPVAKGEPDPIFFEVHIQWSHYSHMSYLISAEAYTIKEVMIDFLTIFPTTIAIPLMGRIHPHFVVTGAQIDLIVQAGLLQVKCKHVCME